MKISTGGLELSGFPVWIIWVLLGVAAIGTALYIYLKLRYPGFGKAEDKKTFSVSVKLVTGIAIATLLVVIGLWWGNRSARTELQNQIATKSTIDVPVVQPTTTIPTAASPTTPSPTPSPDITEARRDKLTGSSWFVAIFALMYAVLTIPFGWGIMRALRFSKWTFNGPLGLPEGSLSAMLVYMLVTFLGFYVLASIFSLSDVKPPDFLLGIVATVIGFYFGSRSGQHKDDASVRTGSVEGTVFDKSESAAIGANIDLSHTDIKKFSQTTDANGKFKFDNVPIGNYEIQATLSGQTPSDAMKVSVIAGVAQTTNLTLKVNEFQR